MEFKGSKGTWNIRDNKLFVDDTYKSICTVHVQSNYEEITFKPKVDVEANANALLISKSPELLDRLNKLVYMIENDIPINLTNTKLLIKSATEL